MQTVTVSPKYQVVIPREIRQHLHLKVGEKLQVFEYHGRVEFVPMRDMKTARGSLKDMPNDFVREKDRL